MKASKKLLSLLLVLTMVFSFAAISASAEYQGVVIFNNNPAPQANQSSGESGGSDANIVSDDDNNTSDETNGTETNGTETNGTENKGDEPEKPKVENPEAAIVGAREKIEYATLREAIAAAADGATVQLMRDITLSSPLVISKSLTLEFAEATIKFKSSDTLYDAALVVDGANVTLRNGEIVFVAVPDSENEGVFYGFKSGLDAADGSLKLRGMNVNGAVVGGSKLANAEGGSINVQDGEFDFDPSAYVDESYAANEADGVFTVAEKPADTQPDTNPTEPDPDEPDDFRVEPDDDIEEKTLTADSSENITVGDKPMLLDLGGYKLTGTVTVGEGKLLQIMNGTVEGAITNDGTLNLAGPLTVSGDITSNGDLIVIDGVTVTGKIVNSGDMLLTDKCTVGAIRLKSGSLTVDSKFVKVDGDIDADATGVTYDITAGTFKDTNKPLVEKVISKDYEPKVGDTGYIDVVKRGVTPTTDPTVTDSRGVAYNNTDNYLQYFKGETELAPNQGLVYIDYASFLCSEAPTAVYIDKAEAANKIDTADYELDANNTLTFKFEQVPAGTGKHKITAPAFEHLDAGPHDIVFTFAGDKVVKAPLYVWPSIDNGGIIHALGDTTAKTIGVSDAPIAVKIDDKEVKKDSNWSYDSTAKKFTLLASCLNSLAGGNRKLSFTFDAASGSEFVTTISIVSVTPVEANKDNKWVNSSNALSYNVSHAVDGVKVDGTALDTSKYSVTDKNVLSLKADFLKTLGYGEHTMIVTVLGKEVEVKFTTGPSLVPKDATNHTKGGSKDLVFIASDPMDAVWIGDNKLKADYYTISEDGKTITLKAAFLNTLKADNTYKIIAGKLDANGAYKVNGEQTKYYAYSNFKILSAASAGATPSTGDTANLALWIGLLVVSGAAIAVILPKRKKEN